MPVEYVFVVNCGDYNNYMDMMDGFKEYLLNYPSMTISSVHVNIIGKKDADYMELVGSYDIKIVCHIPEYIYLKCKLMGKCYMEMKYNDSLRVHFIIIQNGLMVCLAN